MAPSKCLMLAILMLFTLVPETASFRRPPKPSDKNETNTTVKCYKSDLEFFPNDIFTQSQRSHGAIIFHIIVAVYLCIFIGMTCSQYFIPSLERLSEFLYLSADVAGATLMAIGSSAPELFSSLIDVYLDSPDIGLGTLVGSAAFNLLGITGLLGILTWDHELPIYWYPVIKNYLFYIFSLVAVYFIINDLVVTYIEATMILGLYFLYVLTMIYNAPIEKVFLFIKVCIDNLLYSIMMKAHLHSPSIHSPSIPDPERQVRFRSYVNYEGEILRAMAHKKDDEESSLLKGKMKCLIFILRAIFILPRMLLFMTIIDCRNEKLRKFYLLTFIQSLVWIALEAYVLVWMGTIMALTINVPDAMWVKTFLSIATSIPELVSCTILIRNGLSNMCMANLLGSCIFNILFCTGMPWFIKSCIVLEIHLSHAAALSMVISLVGSVTLMLISFILLGWTLNYHMGVTNLVLYIVFEYIIYLIEIYSGNYVELTVCEE